MSEAEYPRVRIVNTGLARGEEERSYTVQAIFGPTGAWVTLCEVSGVTPRDARDGALTIGAAYLFYISKTDKPVRREFLDKVEILL